MTASLRVTILGCSSSPGVPRIDGDWGACDPAEPRNRRLRAAALVERVSENGVTTLVIDVGPDFRQQMLAAGVRHLDGAVITHPHADHFHGLDDLRGFALIQRQRMRVHADKTTYARLFEAFGYCFRAPPGSDYPPIAEHVPMAANEAFSVDGAGGRLEVVPFEQEHGSIRSMGLRIGPLAYCSDVSAFPAAAIRAIEGCQHIVLDALQWRSHPSHLSVDQALAWIERFGARGATLTHMHTPLDYATLAAYLPSHVRPAHDGLCFVLPLDRD